MWRVVDRYLSKRFETVYFYIIGIIRITSIFLLKIYFYVKAF